MATLLATIEKQLRQEANRLERAADELRKLQKPASGPVRRTPKAPAQTNTKAG